MERSSLLFQFHMDSFSVSSYFSVSHGFALESGTGIAKVLRTRADISHHVQSRRIVSYTPQSLHFSLR